MKNSKTTLRELSHKYRNILIKCACLNTLLLITPVSSAWIDVPDEKQPIVENSNVTSWKSSGTRILTPKDEYSGNQFTVIDSMYFSEIDGGHPDPDSSRTLVENNSVTIKLNYSSESTNPQIIYGAYSYKGDTKNNTVKIENGNLFAVVGAFGYTAIGNSVTVTGGIVNEAIYAGSGYYEISNNVVTINGGIINASLIGGWSELEKAINNTVAISGGAFSPLVEIWGGLGQDDQVTENTFELQTKNLNIKSLANFQNYYFVLPTNIVNRETMTTVNNGVVLGGKKNDGTVVKPNIGVAVASGNNTLKSGDKITLLHAHSLNAYDETGTLQAFGPDSENNALLFNEVRLTEDMLKIQQGLSLEYDTVLSSDSQNIYATIQKGATAKDETKSIVEGRVGSVAFLNQAGSLISEQGLKMAAKSLKESKNGVVAFAVADGGQSKYKTGSHVDVKGVNAVTGFTANLFNPYFMAGPFLEFGYADMDTHNAFDSGIVKGNGDAHYVGGGLFVKQERIGCSFIFAEASIRAGYMENDWKSDDMMDPITGKRASYKISVPYFGAHFGLGYDAQLTKEAKLTPYAKYFWTRMGSKKTTVADDPYKFKAVDSQRVRLGVKGEYALQDSWSLNIGAAIEREFNGKGRATVYGLDVASPTLKGNTGIFELGTDYKVNDWTFGVGITEYVGTRQGFSGAFKIEYKF